MATATNINNFDAALKQIYRDSLLNYLTYKTRPLLGILPKYEKFGGRNMPIPVIYGHPQGVSSTFADAQANATQVLVEDFLLTRVKWYSIAIIDGETIIATQNNTEAFISAMKAKVDGTLMALSDKLESDLFRSGTGSLAQLHASTAPTVANPMVLTLAQTEEITNFEVGMSLTCSLTDGGAALSTPNPAVIAGINYSSGTITTDYDNSGAGTNWTTSDYLSQEGTGLEGGSSNLAIAGLDAWVPGSVPGATAFFGVDRTTTGRFYGTIHDGSSDPLEEAGIDGQSKASRDGGRVDCWVLHHAQYRKLVKELGAKKEYTQTQAQSGKGMVANVAYKGVLIDGDHGPIETIAANKCPATKSWMLQKDTWTLATTKKAVGILREDGLRIQRQASADGYEIRTGGYGNLGCNGPIYNAHVTLANP